MNWLPQSENQFIQCSEDLRLRIFDVRDDIIEPTHSIVTGTNFVQCTDIDKSGNYILTGHKGFNNEGCSVKMWDIRKFTEGEVEPVFEYQRSFSVVSTRFMNTDMIITGTADKKLSTIDMKGKHKEEVSLDFSITSVAPLRP